MEGSNGLYNATQSITLIPEVEMDEKKLFCTFLQVNPDLKNKISFLTQVDGAGQEIFVSQNSVELAVHSLSMDPEAAQEWTVRTGEDLEVSLRFTALPQPREGDVVRSLLL